MPNWKKVITSGSDAILNSLTTNGVTITGSLLVSGSSTFKNSIFTVTGSQYFTGSSTFIGNQTLSGSLNVTGSGIFAGYLVANGNLGVNTNNPTIPLDIHGNVNSGNVVQIDNVQASRDTRIMLLQSGSSAWFLGNEYDSGNNNFAVWDATAAPIIYKRLSITTAGGVTAASFTGSLLGTASYATQALLSTNVVGSANRILFNNGTNTTTTSNELTWTDSTNLLTLGSVAGTAGTISKLALYTSSFGGYGFGVSPAQLDYVTDGSHVFYKKGVTPTELLRISSTGNVLITGSLTVGSSSLGASENTLTLGPSLAGGAGEGGQLGLNAAGGSYTSASMLDNYQNRLRILKGTNAGSDSELASWNLVTKQMFLPSYNSVSSYSGTAAALLAVNSSGDVITVSTGSGGGGTTPGGSNGQIQYNNSSAFGGVSNLTWDGTVLKATGSFTGSLTGILTGTASWAANATSTTAVNGTQYYIPVFTTSNTLGNSVLIQSASNIGIGTSTARTKLNITNGDISAYNLSGSGTTSIGAQIYLGDSNFESAGYYNSAPGIGAVYSPLTTVPGDLALYTYNGFANNRLENMRLFKGGNVGIGTSITSSFRLDVSGSSRFTSNMIITGSVIATSFTGSLLGTASYASQALSSSFATTASYVAVFPYTGSATITGSLVVTGSTSIRQSNGTVSGSSLLVYGSGSANPIFSVQGSQGELFSVTDSLSGSLFSVNDISGLPILEAFSDNTVLLGSYQAPVLLTTNRAILTSSGQFTLSIIPTASYDGAFYNYTARSGSNARAGSIVAMWSGTTVNFTETTTTDFGSTSGLSLGVFISGSNMVLTGSASTTAWTIKTIINSI